MAKAWDCLKPEVDCFGGWYVDPTYTMAKPTTACKHGRDECGVCGTTNLRDVRHTTIDGRGVVARIPK